MKISLFIGFLFLFISSNEAAPILLSQGKSVTGSAYYNSTGGEVFHNTNITDGLFNDTGSAGDWSFWLTPQGSLGYAIIDLEAVYNISRFEVQNTHNRVHNDRSTANFQISTSVDGISYTTRVTGTLTNILGQNPIPIETFMIAATSARYVRFDVLSYLGASGGLNELSVYGEVSVIPESECLILAIAGLAGVYLARHWQEK